VKPIIAPVRDASMVSGKPLLGLRSAAARFLAACQLPGKPLRFTFCLVVKLGRLDLFAAGKRHE
jgi:hypothetical protein